MIAGLLPALARDLERRSARGRPSGHRLLPRLCHRRAGHGRADGGAGARRLLAVAMGGFALANLLAALAPGYAGCWPRGCCWPCPQQASCRRPADMPPHWAGRSGVAALCPWSPAG